MSERLERPTECCEVLTLVLSRQPGSGSGMTRESMINFATGETRDMVVIRFRRARKGEPQEYRHATFAPVNYCPFCGAKTAEEPSTETAAASGTTRRTPQKERAR